MKDLVIHKIEQSIEDRKSLYSKYDESISTFKPFVQLEKSAMTEASLSTRIKELMALSIAIVTKCEPCMEWHLEQALLAGATDENVYETIDVAAQMGGGPALAYSRFVMIGLDYFKEKHGL